jgi:hypothetical protein
MVTSKEDDACFDEAHRSVVYFVGGQLAMETDDAEIRATAPASRISHVWFSHNLQQLREPYRFAPCRNDPARPLHHAKSDCNARSPAEKPIVRLILDRSVVRCGSTARQHGCKHDRKPWLELSFQIARPARRASR